MIILKWVLNEGDDADNSCISVYVRSFSESVVSQNSLLARAWSVSGPAH
jgi:hypothetical protein